MLRFAAPIWNGRGSLGMTKEMLWLLMGHLVCIGQWAAFIMVEYAFLGRYYAGLPRQLSPERGFALGETPHLKDS